MRDRRRSIAYLLSLLGIGQSSLFSEDPVLRDAPTMEGDSDLPDVMLEGGDEIYLVDDPAEGLPPGQSMIVMPELRRVVNSGFVQGTPAVLLG
ncbi:MAG: hypothetical protein ACT4O5_14415 [Gammaproteobacteria bacterium]